MEMPFNREFFPYLFLPISFYLSLFTYLFLPISFSLSQILHGYGIPVIKLYLGRIGFCNPAEKYSIADYYSALWGKAILYPGIIGYLLFFTHRYHVAKRRHGVIKDLNLLEKVRIRQKLAEKDFEGLECLLWSLCVSKERTNYFIISVFSVLAVARLSALTWES